jgi:ATP phosphoribosyltransferase regulatory subunit
MTQLIPTGTHPIPSGTRDVLPDEMRELRAITESLRSVFDRAGYGEIYTPALEYEAVLGRAALAGARPAYRVFDETGQVLALRSDMTVPIARVVATRYPTSEPPLRFSYFAHSYRGVRPQRGQLREILQAGVELIGAPAPGGTAEAVTVMCHALGAVGLEDYRVGLGDASLYPALLASLSVPDAVQGLRLVHELLEPAVAERVIFDLGLSRDIGYYTGAVFEIYDPTVGIPIGGGGRYDELLGRFGRPLPAVGFAVAVDRLHVALAGEERRLP